MPSVSRKRRVTKIGWIDISIQVKKVFPSKGFSRFRRDSRLMCYKTERKSLLTLTFSGRITIAIRVIFVLSARKVGVLFFQFSSQTFLKWNDHLIKLKTRPNGRESETLRYYPHSQDVPFPTRD